MGADLGKVLFVLVKREGVIRKEFIKSDDASKIQFEENQAPLQVKPQADGTLKEFDKSLFLAWGWLAKGPGPVILPSSVDIKNELANFEYADLKIMWTSTINK